MDAVRRESLISVKRNLLRHPLVIGGGAASLVALLALNATAFATGLQAPWLLGSVILADMFVIGAGVLVAAREVMSAEQDRAQARHALEESELRRAAIVEGSEDAIVGISLDGVIESWNAAAERIFGYAAREAVGRPIELIVPEERRAEEEAVLARIARGEAVQHFETQRRAKDGRLLEVALTVSPIRDGAGRLVGASKISRDIGPRKRAETDAARMQSALSAAQARLGAIVDSAMDAVLTVDEEQKLVLFNRAAEQVFGMPRSQALGSPLDRFLPERFRHLHRRHVAQFGDTGITSRRMGDVTTLWALRADGTEFPIEASISQVREGGKRYFTVILRDITLRKQHEDDLQRQQQELRELSARVLEAREEEKTRIARELHDELGQLLTALKMDLSWLRERLAPGELGEKTDEMAQLLDQTVSATRRISADLRPLMLDDLGLAEAAGWLVEDFSRRSGIAVEARIAEDIPLESLSKSAATAIYRAVQESLTNIARHAGAKHAWVVIEVDDEALYVEVEDDGRGIAPQDLAKSRSLGLKGMRERVAYLGGALEIGRAARGGTRLRLRMPLRGMLPEESRT